MWGVRGVVNIADASDEEVSDTECVHVKRDARAAENIVRELGQDWCRRRRSPCNCPLSEVVSNQCASDVGSAVVGANHIAARAQEFIPCRVDARVTLLEVSHVQQGEEVHQNHFHQKKFHQKTTFIRNHFHQKPLPVRLSI